MDEITKSTKKQTLVTSIPRIIVALPTLFHGAVLICRIHYLAPFHMHVDVLLRPSIYRQPSPESHLPHHLLALRREVTIDP